MGSSLDKRIHSTGNNVFVGRDMLAGEMAIHLTTWEQDDDRRINATIWKNEKVEYLTA